MAEQQITENARNISDKFVKIGVIGDFEPDRPSHIATNEALMHCAAFLGIEPEVEWLPTEALEAGGTGYLYSFDGLWCAPGSPYKSMKGALNGIRFARVHDIPFIGTCGGFQHAVIEYAANVLGLIDLSEGAFDPYAPNIFITALSCSLLGETKKITIDTGSKVYGYYGLSEVEERYNCNFGLNPECLDLLEKKGFKAAGRDENGEVRLLELSGNLFYLATLFQPQLSSSARNPNKLILAYLTSARDYKTGNIKEGRR